MLPNSNLNFTAKMKFKKVTKEVTFFCVFFHGVPPLMCKFQGTFRMNTLYYIIKRM